jgi:hypothetical protein
MDVATGALKAGSDVISAAPPRTMAAAADSAVRRKKFRDLCITDSLNRCMVVDRRKEPHHDS